MDELKPCPFCGADANFIEDEDSDGRFISVQCTGCGCGGGRHYPVMDDAQPNAASEWNRRILPDLTIAAWISRAGLKNWMKGQYAEAHVLLRAGNKMRVPLYAPALDVESLQENRKVVE